MKKTLYHIASVACCLAMTLTACTNNSEELAPDTSSATVITATQGGEMTRLTYEDNTDGFIVKWVVGDKFRLYSNDPGITFTAISVRNNGKSALFTNEGGLCDGAINTFFPAAKAEKNWADCHFNVLGQVIDAGEPLAHLSDYNYMTAQLTDIQEATAGTLAFEHQIAVLRFDLNVPTDNLITAVSLSTQNDAGIAINKNAVTGTETLSKHLTATVVNGTNELTAYLAVLPSTLTQQLALAVTTTTGEGQKTYNYTVTFDATDFGYKAGHIYRTTLDFAAGGTGYNNVSVLTNTTQPDYFTTGSGTADSPYLITNAGQLLQLRNNINNNNLYYRKYFRLTTDIHVTADTWEPIGYYSSTSSNPFNAYFDGGGHTISGTLTAPDDYAYEAYGLFGCTHKASISNLHLAANIVSGATQNCIGGIVGILSYTTISDCTMSGDVTVNYTGTNLLTVGGIGGDLSNYDAIYNNCVMTGNIHFDTDKQVYAGGIAGKATTLTHCTNTGSITGNTRNGYIGGIVGWGTTVKFCRNSGAINVTTAGIGFVGGIAGNVITIHTSHNTSTQISGGGYPATLTGYSDQDQVFNCCSSVEVGSLPYHFSTGLVPVTTLIECDGNH